MGRNLGGGGGGGSFSGGGGSFGGGGGSHFGGGGSFGGGRSGRNLSGGGRSSGSGSFFGGSSSGGGSFGSGGSHSGGGGSFGSSGRNTGPGPQGPPPGGFGGPGVPPGGFGGPGPARGWRPPIIIPVGGGSRRRATSQQVSGAPRTTGCAAAMVIVAIIIALALVVALIPFGQDGGGTDEVRASTVTREKLDNPAAYKNEVHDELGWLNTDNVARGIRPFYDKTGVQPAIYLTSNPDIIGDQDAQKAEAKRIFDELGLTPNDFLFVYFDDGNGQGDWVTQVGDSAGTVMDSEAVQIFGDYLNKYWWTEGLSEDEMFIDTFTDTADHIMTKTTTANDIWLYVWIVLAIVAAGVVIFVIMRQRRKHEAERAAETERILKTDLNDVDSDPLLNKYDKK